jgi:hypothetical protein
MWIVVLSVCPQWNRAEDDEAVKASVARFSKMTMVLLEKEGLLHRWVYPNYASEVQDVFAGYGEENRGKMKKIQRKYDPDGVFDGCSRGISRCEGVDRVVPDINLYPTKGPGESSHREYSSTKLPAPLLLKS